MSRENQCYRTGKPGNPKYYSVILYIYILQILMPYRVTTGKEYSIVKQTRSDAQTRLSGQRKSRSAEKTLHTSWKIRSHVGLYRTSLSKKERNCQYAPNTSIVPTNLRGCPCVGKYQKQREPPFRRQENEKKKSVKSSPSEEKYRRQNKTYISPNLRRRGSKIRFPNHPTRSEPFKSHVDPALPTRRRGTAVRLYIPVKPTNQTLEFSIQYNHHNGGHYKRSS